MIARDRSAVSRTLIILGVAIGPLALAVDHRPGLGRLPATFWSQRELFTVYAPVTTGILVSTVLSLNPWVFSR
jgi:Protein of unknown function (DUF2905)